MAGQALSFSVEGVAELNRILTQLPKSMRRTPLTNALKKAGEPTRALAAANCPRSAGGADDKPLADTIEVSPRLNPNQKRQHQRLADAVQVFVGSTSPLAHLVEFGTAERFRPVATGSGSTGRMPANPFLTRAWDATKDQALGIIRTELWQEVRKAVQRLVRRAEKGTLSVKVQRELLR